MVKKIFLTIFTVVMSLVLQAQYTTKGKNFWLSFFQNEGTTSQHTPTLFITSKFEASGTVNIPGTGWTQNFNITPNNSVTIELPTNVTVTSGNTVLERGINVTSDNNISVYAANLRNKSADATVVYPIQSIGDSYFVSSSEVQSYNITGFPSQFAVVGVENGTNIEIIPTENIIGGVNAGVPFTITLNQGQVYFVRSATDLTGTVVRAVETGDCNNFAVFSGHRCARIPVPTGYCDHLYEQMLPLKSWGQEYITVSLMNKTEDFFKIIASEDNTNISINGGANFVLNSGEIHELYMQDPAYIEADKPIIVIQYCTGINHDGVNSDPFMLMLTALENTLDYMVFETFSTDMVDEFYTNMITKTSDINEVLLNGNPVAGWTTLPANPLYSYAQKGITEGTHILESPKGMLATVYGFGHEESYGFLAGVSSEISFDVIINEDSIAYNIFEDTLDCIQAIDGAGFYTDAPNITDVHWNFGDGNTATGNYAHHIYDESGSYTVTMYFTLLPDLCFDDSLSVVVHVADQLPPFDFINDTVICNGEPFDIILDIPGVLYLWQDDSTDPTHHVSSSGTYSVTISDNMGCVAVENTEVLFVDFSVSADVNDVTCAGMNDGSITIIPEGGSEPYDYNWSITPPVYTQTVLDLEEGTYFVTVYEANGCFDTISVTINAPDDFYVNIDDLQNISCYGYENGAVIINVTGGEPPIDILWNDPNISGFNPQNLSEGNYYFTITDANDCQIYDSFDITEPEQIIINEEIINVDCFGNETGAITLSVSEGEPPFSYLWSNDETSSNISNLTTGTYSVTITDSNDCEVIESYTITSPDEIIINADITNIDCYGGPPGEIYINAYGGIPPYTYLWNNNDTVNSISNLNPGTYSVTVTDENNCTAVKTYIITEPDHAVEIITELKNIGCYGDYSGEIILDAAGGTAPFTFVVTGPYYNQTGNIHTGLGMGEYNIFLSDAHGCTDTATVSLVSPDALTGNFVSHDPSCYGNNDGYIEITVFGGTEPYIFMANDIISETNYIPGLTGDKTYDVYVYDANDCELYLGEANLKDDPYIDCITIPNAFTPNGDGINDEWVIENIELFSDAAITVFNRWGQKVYNAQGTGQPWDGTYKGRELPTGSYMYVINLYHTNTDKDKYLGIVTILY